MIRKTVLAEKELNTPQIMIELTDLWKVKFECKNHRMKCYGFEKLGTTSLSNQISVLIE